MHINNKKLFHVNFGIPLPLAVFATIKDHQNGTGRRTYCAIKRDSYKMANKLKQEELLP